MTTPDWIYGGTEGGTYRIDGEDEGVEFDSGPVPFDRLPDPGMFYIGAAHLPVNSKLAGLGVRGVLQQVTPEGQVIVTVKYHRGPLGWIARRWISRHPLVMTYEIYRPEWGEWRKQVGRVR